MIKATFDAIEVTDFIHGLEFYPENVHVEAGLALCQWAIDEADVFGKQTVFGWSRQPTFDSDIVTDEQLTMTAYWGTDSDVWNWLDQGTGLYGERRSKYPIVAKNAPYLVFRTGYIARTVPNSFTGNSAGGRYTGPYRRKKKVMHPGIKSRNWFNMVQQSLSTNWMVRYFEFLGIAMVNGLDETAKQSGSGGYF